MKKTMKEKRIERVMSSILTSVLLICWGTLVAAVIMHTAGQSEECMHALWSVTQFFLITVPAGIILSELVDHTL